MVPSIQPRSRTCSGDAAERNSVSSLQNRLPQEDQAMKNEMEFDRRNLLVMGSAGMLSAMRANAKSVVHEVAMPGQDPAAQPTHHIKFSVIGLDHNHIMSMTAA